MKVLYNLTGAARKPLVEAVSAIVGVAAEYMRAPTYSYRVGSFEIDKDGALSALPGTDHEVFERLLIQLYMKDFHYTAREDDVEDEDVDTAISDDEEALVDTPTIEEVAARGWPLGTDEGEATRFEISVPAESLTDSQLEILNQLISSKASLIKKSLGVDTLSIIEGGERITFPWFDRELDSFEIKTYTHFITALCEAARTQRRVIAKDKAVTSERFTFRVFLLKLGFAGREYTEERKLLYKNLTGDCAFPNTTKRDEHAERWKRIRQEQRSQIEPVAEQESEPIEKVVA